MSRTRKPQHSSLTEPARRAADALKRAGLLPHPGVISARGGRTLRVVVVPEPKRIRISVSSSGHQEIFLYGSADLEIVMTALRGEFGIIVILNDIHGLKNDRDIDC